MFLFFSLFQLHYKIQKWSQQEIAKAVVSAGYEQKYSEDAVGLRINREFAKLQKLVFLQADEVNERLQIEIAKLQKLLVSQ